MRAAPFRRCAELVLICRDVVRRAHRQAMSRAAPSAKLVRPGKAAGVRAEETAKSLRIEQRAGRGVREVAEAAVRDQESSGQACAPRFPREIGLGEEAIHSSGEATRIFPFKASAVTAIQAAAG